jgi:hypothetical protein
MVEWTKALILILVAATLAVIGVFLPWYYIAPSGSPMGLGVSPLLGCIMMGIPIIQTLVLGKIAGIVAIAGGVLMFGAISKPKLALVGGILALVGAVLFIVSLLVEGILIYGETNVTYLPLFGAATAPVFSDVTCYLTYGFFMVVAAGIIGIIASFKQEDSI